MNVSTTFLFIKRWLPAAGVMSLIFALSSVKGQTIDDAGLGDNTLHVIGHYAMYFLLCLSLYRGTKSIPSAVLFTILFGITDEYHQTYTLERSASVEDVLTDWAAALAAGVLLWKSYQDLPKILKDWLKA